MPAGTAERFTLDTNVLVYALDRAAGPRRDTASLIVECAPTRDCVLGLQAISEFFVVATGKRNVPHREALEQALDWLALFRTFPYSPDAVRTALAEADAGRASYWDALLIAAAAEAGCTAILTEDLQDGATLLGVRVLNPFSRDGLSPTARALLGL